MSARFPFPTLFVLFATLLLAASACTSTDVVESGTYEGTITEINADEVEIYVKTDDGKTLELYFTESTTVQRDTLQASFEDLREDQRVRVEVSTVGRRLDPVSVEILP